MYVISLPSLVVPPQEVCVSDFPPLSGALDYKLCPQTAQLTGCVCQGEVWVLDSVTGEKHRMTFATGTKHHVLEMSLPQYDVLWYHSV